MEYELYCTMAMAMAMAMAMVWFYGNDYENVSVMMAVPI